MVVGNVNANLSCSVTAKKEGVRVCHIKAGLRLDDMSMPEEINRLDTDRLSNLLLTPDHLSVENLRREGVAEGKIVFVGNIMIETLEANRAKAAALDIATICKENGFGNAQGKKNDPGKGNFAQMTLHRLFNVDDLAVLRLLVDFLCAEVASEMPVIWPIYLLSLKRLKEFNLLGRVENANGVVLLNPSDYHEMLCLKMDARTLLTAIGGLQEEYTLLGTLCLTKRWDTEQLITLREHGGASV